MSFMDFGGCGIPSDHRCKDSDGSINNSSSIEVRKFVERFEEGHNPDGKLLHLLREILKVQTLARKRVPEDEFDGAPSCPVGSLGVRGTDAALLLLGKRVCRIFLEQV